MKGVPVKGLFLSGGQSQRMGTDKGLLRYRENRSEIERWNGIFDELDIPFFWSQRPGQYPQDLFPHITRLIDQSPGAGPLGALVSAVLAYPNDAWLVLACDWPLLGRDELVHLLRARRPDYAATAYRHEGRRQPLFSLYEPAFLKTAAQAWDEGQRSLDRLLHASEAWDVGVVSGDRFVNVNDPLARQRAETAFRMGSSPHHSHQSAH